MPLGISAHTATSALGRGVAAHAEALRHDRSGLRQRTFETSALETWIGEVADLDAPLPPSLASWECRNNRLAMLGLEQDDFSRQVRLAREKWGAQRVGVFIGTSTAGIHQAELAYRERDRVANRLPATFDHRRSSCTSSVAEFVRTLLALEGPCAAISTACSSSAKVFASARRALNIGLCDAAVVGGVDTLCLTTLHGFNSLQLVSREACRPADVARNGLSIGEAAGFALLQREPSELALLGDGESSDAYHMSAPHPDGLGAVESMRAALRRAQLSPADIDYVNLHGTATPANDLAEDKAVCAVFGTETPLSSTKGWTGHTLGAAGILEAVLSLCCVDQGLIPRSLNTSHVDPNLAGNILLETRLAPVRRVMSNSFGFGGSNCSLILGRWP